jgi:hypothetical protein
LGYTEVVIEKGDCDVGLREVLAIANFFPITLPEVKRASIMEALSARGLQRRRSESNRRMEVLQTSALPLGYGAAKDR